MEIKSIKEFIVGIIMALGLLTTLVLAVSNNQSGVAHQEYFIPMPTPPEHNIPITPPTVVESTPIVEDIVPNPEEEKWLQKSEEYYYATYIWQTLKSWGWNDYVCAGIMGNLMRETAGDTFNINPGLYDSSRQYYGICQWSKKYCPAVQGTSLEVQLDYLKTTVEKEFNTFGYKYSSGFTYWHFTQITNEREAALAFAKCYERCSSAGYTKRQNNATRAYQYFVG